MDIAGYEDLVEVGRGASAVVYRARQVAFDRVVAVKVLSTAGLGEEVLRRFTRECKVIGNLGWHPHVVPVFDAGVTPSGHAYLVMDYLPAGSLATRLHAEGRLPEREVVAIGTQVADALAAAHRAGVLHRDVKPGNVLVGHFGEARLADFGIAAVTSANTSVTDALAGTLSFMAPELLRGGKATAAADVYSLGSTLFALLTGRTAYSSPTDDSPLAAVMRVANDPLPNLRDEGVSDAVATVIERCMAKAPDERLPDAARLVVALHAAAATMGWPMQPTYADRAPTATAAPSAAPAPAPAAPPDDQVTVLRDRPNEPPRVSPAEGQAPAHHGPGAGSVDPISGPTTAPGAVPGVPPAAAAHLSGDVTIARSAVPAASSPPPPPPPAPAAVQAPSPPPPVDATVVDGVPLGASTDEFAQGEPVVPPHDPVGPDAVDGGSSGSARRWWLVGAAVLVVVVLGGIVAAVAGGGGGTKGAEVSAGAAPTTTERTTTTIATTTTRPSTTTTAPPQSPEDILRANPAGTYKGLVKNSRCPSSGLKDPAESCKNSGPPNPMEITCAASGCAVSMWAWEGEDPKQVSVPLTFDGTYNVGSADLDLGWSCKNGKITSRVEFKLKTTKATYQDGRWRSSALNGTYTHRNLPGVCTPTTLGYDLIYERTG